jgi:hypothetical protein
MLASVKFFAQIIMTWDQNEKQTIMSPAVKFAGVISHLEKKLEKSYAPENKQTKKCI